MLTTKKAKKRSLVMLILFAFVSIGIISFFYAFFAYRVMLYPSAWVVAMSLVAIMLISATIRAGDQVKETAD